MGHYIIVKAVIQDKTYVLMNIYTPNKDKDIINFFKNLFAVLQKENLESEENIIIGWAFNCPLNPELAALKDSCIKCVNECFEKGEISNSKTSCHHSN